jgi:hypothetical protein
MIGFDQTLATQRRPFVAAANGYVAPHIVVYGSVTTLTAAGSSGALESVSTVNVGNCDNAKNKSPCVPTPALP